MIAMVVRIATVVALLVNLAGFVAIYKGLQVGPSPLYDVTTPSGAVFTCQAGTFYGPWPEGLGVKPPPGPHAPDGKPWACPYGTSHARAEIDVNNESLVNAGFAMTVASIAIQALLALLAPSPKPQPVAAVAAPIAVDDIAT